MIYEGSLIETADGKHYLLNFLEFDATGTVTKIDYLGITDFQEYLVGHHSAVPAWAWVAAAAGAIGIAAASGGSGGSSHSGSGDKTGPKLSYDILDNQKIKITADEASKITIVDASGKTIGSGQLNQAGALEINLTRPLVDNEKITITATDNAGNKTTETINVGDVTKPEVEINIIDNDTIQVNSNEPGSKVIIKNEAGQIIAEGVIGPDGKLIVDLNTPLTDGSKIIVDVIDAAGNQTEKVITVGDVTPPIISTTIQDATHIQVTSNEAGQVKITDGQGNVIGTGTITGNNTVDNIQLTRPLTDGETIKVTVTDGAGNPKTVEITAGDVTAPVITTTIQDATHVEVTSNETGQVKITDGHGNVIGTGTITGNNTVDNVQLTRPLTDGETITVTVTDGAGNPKTVEITAGDVTNPQFQSAHVDSSGTQLTLTYSEALDSANLPPSSSFSVNVGGQLVNVTGISVNGNVVILTLGTPVTAGQAVTVGYTDPTTANDPNAIQDAAGNDAATLPPTAVDNGSIIPGGDTTAPTFVSATVDLSGTTLTLTYNEALDPLHPPVAGDFAVTADGQLVPVTGVVVVGNNVVLTLGAPVTLGQAVTVGYTDPTTANDPNAIQDAAGNDAATLPPTAVDNGSIIPGGDTTAPTFVSATVDLSGTTLTLTYNEALDPLHPPVAGDFAVTADGQLVPVTGVVVVGNNVVLTLGAPVTLGQAVTVGYTDPTTANDPNAIQDAAGNDAATLPPTAVDNGSIIPGGDTTAPTFVSATVDLSGTTLTLTYNEALDPLHPPVAGDFAVTADGQLVAVTGVVVVGNNVVLTLGAPVTLGQAVTVGYTDPTTGNDPNAIQDAAGNDAATLPATAVDNGSIIPGGDTTAPTFVSATVDLSGTTLTLTYNEALDPLHPPVAGDFAVTADGQLVPVTGVAVVGNNVVLTLGAPVTLGQAVTVGYTDPTTANDPNAIQDAAGNDAATLPPTAVDNGSIIPGGDTTAPTFVSATVDLSGTTLTLTYNEALDPLHPPVAGDFAVTADGQLVPVTGVAVVGNNVVLTLGAPVTLGQAVTVGYTDPTTANDPNAIQDAAGNDAATLPATAVDNGSIIPGGDTTAPTFVSATVDLSGTTLTLTYNEALDPLHPPVAGDFAVTADGQLVPVTGVVVVGNNVVLTLGAPVTLGQAVTVGYTDPTTANDPNAIQDAAGNDAATLPPTAVDNGSIIPGGDTTAPTFVSATVDLSGTTLTLTYNEALDPLHPPVAGDFAVTADGQLVAVTGVVVVGNNVVLTLGAPVTLGQAVTVGYTDPTTANDPNAIQDAAGNDAATLPPTAVDNGSIIPGGDTTAPTFVSATVDLSGTTLTLTYNEALDPLHPPVAGDFAVTADGQLVPVTGVVVVGNNVVLTLGAPVTLGQAVTVGYTDPTTANDPNAIQDAAGNDAATLPPTAVDNGSIIPGGDTTAPTFVSATVDLSGTTLTLTYNEALDPLHPPVAGDFAVTADGQLVPVTGVVVVGNNVVLTLGAPVTLGQAVTVGYTDPTTANDPNAIQDAAGNDAATLPPTAVDNGSIIPGGDTTAPTFVSATVDLSGTTLTLTYNEALDPLHPPVAGDFAVTADGQLVPVTGVVVVGNNVVLTLGAPVTLGQAVTVGYTDPTTANDPNAIQDAAGNDAATLPPTAVDNGSIIPGGDTTAPTFVSATVDLSGTTLTLTYNEALDPLHPPVAGDFAVTADGQLVPVTGVAVVGNNVVLTLGAPVTLGQAVTVGYTDPTTGNDPNAIQDAAGNDAATLPATAVDNGSIIPGGDTTAPTFVSATVDLSGTTLTLTYNEALDPLHPPVAGDFAVTADGQLVPVTGVAVVGNNVVLTLGAPVTLGQAVTVGYTDPTTANDPNAIQDAAGNDAATLPPTAVDNGSIIPGGDTTAPTFVSATVDLSGTTLTLTYNEALDPLHPPVAGDFAVTADGQLVPVTGVAVVGNNVVLTLGAPVTLGQAVTVGYTDPTTANDPNAIQDAAGNDAATLPATAVDNGSIIPGGDTTAPTFVSATVDLSGTTLTLTYNEALDSANLPPSSSFSVNVGGQLVNVTGISVNGNVVILTLGTPVTAGQAVTVGYTDPTTANDPNAIQDAAGNDAATLPPTAVDNGSIIPGGDTTAPTFVSATVDLSGTTLTLTYNEALDPLHPPVAGDFAVTADGQLVPVTGVAVVGNNVVLTLGAPVTLGQAVTVGYTDPTTANDPNAIQDAAGNDAATLPPTAVDNGSIIPGGDTTAPTFVSATVDLSGTTLTLTYNEALDPLHPPVAGDFAVTADGQLVPVTGVAVVGNNVVLTLGAPVTLGQAVTVGYTDPTTANDPNAIQDAAGNDAATLPPTAVDNGSIIPGGDTTAPTFVSATVDLSGTTLTLTYNEALDPLHPPVAGDFAVTADGQLVPVTGVAVVGNNVVLTLGAPVTLGQAVTVGYTDPTTANDPNAIQDAAGNDAATLPPTAVDNGSIIPGGDTTAPTFVSATVDLSGTTLTLTYNEALDPLHPPVAGDFAVTADGQLVPVTGVVVVGNNVVLTLGAPVTLGQAVTVGYTDPTTANDPNAIQDAAGNDAATLPPTAVDNGSIIPGGDTTAPTFVSATVDLSGTTLTLTYNEALDPLHPPVAGDFAVTADGQLVPVTGVVVVGNNVVLTLGAPVTLGQAVTVGYTDPTTANDPNAIQDAAGNDAATLPPTAVDNGSVVLPPLNAVNDEFALNLGQEVRENRTEVAGSDIAVVDLLGNNATGLDFSIPQTTGSAGKATTGNISVTVSQQDLISVGEAVQIVIYQQTANGPVEVARGSSQGGIVTVGGIGIIGVVNSNDSIKLDFTNLPEGNYTVAVKADDSALTTLLKDVAISDLGGEGEILGASNAAAIGVAINAVLGPVLGAPILALVNTILIPVNTIGLPLSSVVNQLLDVLPIGVIDYIVNAAVAPLLSNLLTIYEKTNISVTGTEEVFANYALTGNVFADNGNGQDVVSGGSIIEIDGASVTPGTVTIQGEYGSLEINTLTEAFTYTVTAGEAALGKTEIFDYKLSNGTTSDTAQIIINIAGTPADPGELTPPDHVDQVVAHDDLATVKNYHESAGDDVGVHGRASQLLGVNLLGLNISLGNTVPFNFEVEENSTSSIHVNVSGSVVSAAIGGLIGALLGTADKFFNAVLERQYVDENGVIQKEHFIVEDAVKLTPPGLLGIIFNYSGQINLDNLPPGVYTIALQEKPTDSGLLQQILNLLDSTASAQLFGGVELTMQDQTNKYLGSSTIEGNVITSVDGADEVNTTTFVTKVANEVGDPAVTLSGANTVVVGAYGTLYISPNGHYKYVSNGNPADIGKVDTFTYTIKDFNGSEASAHLNIRIDGDNSGVVWDNTNPQNDVSLPTPIILDNAEHVAIGAVTNVVQTVSETTQGASFAVAGSLGGGSGTYVPTTFSVANTDSSHVVVKVNIPSAISLLPTVVLTIKDQSGTVVGTITGKPLLNALGSSITVDMPNLGPGTYTITASVSGNVGFGFNATVSLAQDITHYNEIAPVTPAAITGNMLTDDTYNPSYAKFSIDTGSGHFVEVGYNGVTVQGEYGSLFVKSDGSYVYTPSAGVIGRQEVFDYKLSVFGQDHIASLTVTVDAITTGDALRNTLISGELNDTFTGHAGSDVLVYHVLESASASGGNGVDHWTDFHSGNVNTDTNADIIDISDLLIGFNSTNITADLTASANYLKNYLGVRVDGNNVTLTLDRDGAGTTYTGKTDLLQLDNLAQSGAAFNGKTEDDILKLLLQNHQLVL
ncbi:BapA/Bap/LapF family large adhesin [Acinetobacter sp. NyZ410]|nr:BapA/Bap/LapF family large adhesin [Acinetobacter sp. NyZ410]UOH17076.1 Ig-like domain-containing protein [Acinetobacter sp. NyZ410]